MYANKETYSTENTLDQKKVYPPPSAIDHWKIIFEYDLIVIFKNCLCCGEDRWHSSHQSQMLIALLHQRKSNLITFKVIQKNMSLQVFEIFCTLSNSKNTYDSLVLIYLFRKKKKVHLRV